MKEGYIYILENQSLKDNLIKIGRTTKEPEVRAKELYTTGVPESFSISFACKVGDCILAEKQIHQILENYRHNSKREFFVMSTKIAKENVLEVCKTINLNLGLPIDDIIIRDNSNQSLEDIIEDYNYSEYNIIIADLNYLELESLLENRNLTDIQKNRANIIYNILGDFLNMTCEFFVNGFSEDVHPEREILIWEHIAKSFLNIPTIDDFSKEQTRNKRWKHFR
ncbi:hypothetical protein PCC8801_3235 [Rippkaea orientalis PCC 8801]|uniref:Bacteriophage T5 Orf172 DNA-binding domain-containing protein n=1 Tax=Rippkaea orientalis (strain PCC 8801 / RF-1) TaxID=41431 RepID=B7JYA8_RIPO1|nr:GIY-YIG nuclease family protein [Rippkaea orientalis]ACK67210.1 hypothetical protein PCC8801_3235 [Rippkaea orientalis PCC 8801]